MSDKSIDDLRWIRSLNPSFIPKYLVEQVRDRDYTVEDFFKYQEAICVRNDGQTVNPLSHLYVLADKNNIIKGFMWFTIDALSKDLCIQTYSVDKEYWFQGKAMIKAADLVKKVRKEAGLNKIYWITNYVKHSERYGFKKSDSVLMEYTEEDEKTTKDEASESSDNKPHGGL